MEWYEYDRQANLLKELENILLNGSKRREEIKKKRLEQERFAQQEYSINVMTPREDQGR